MLVDGVEFDVYKKALDVRELTRIREQLSSVMRRAESMKSLLGEHVPKSGLPVPVRDRKHVVNSGLPVPVHDQKRAVGSGLPVPVHDPKHVATSGSPVPVHEQKHVDVGEQTDVTTITSAPRASSLKILLEASGRSATTPNTSGRSQTTPKTSGQSQTAPKTGGRSQTAPKTSGQSQSTPETSGRSQTAPKTRNVNEGGAEVNIEHTAARCESRGALDEHTNEGKPAPFGQRDGHRGRTILQELSDMPNKRDEHELKR